MMLVYGNDVQQAHLENVSGGFTVRTFRLRSSFMAKALLSISEANHDMVFGTTALHSF